MSYQWDPNAGLDHDGRPLDGEPYTHPSWAQDEGHCSGSVADQAAQELARASQVLEEALASHAGVPLDQLPLTAAQEQAVRQGIQHGYAMVLPDGQAITRNCDCGPCTATHSQARKAAAAAARAAEHAGDQAAQPVPRIGDAERDEVIEALREHFAAGRLRQHEVDERLAAALDALTQPELDALLTDLPAGRLPAPAPAAAPAPAHQTRVTVTRCRPATWDIVAAVLRTARVMIIAYVILGCLSTTLPLVSAVLHTLVGP